MATTSTGGASISRKYLVGGLAGVVIAAVAAGGIAGAVGPSDASVAGNVISAGHLRIEVNRGTGSDISFENLIPGESRAAYQLVTADMTGIAAAALSLTLSGGADTPFTRQTSVVVSYSEPVPASAIDWDGTTCTPTGGFPVGNTHTVAHLSGLATPDTFALGALTDTATALCVRYVLTLAGSAGNKVQGDSGGFAMQFSLSQTASLQSGGTP